MGTRIVLLLFSIFCTVIANAQVGHGSLLNIGNYCVDFKTEPPTISEIPRDKQDAFWYVDAKGELALYYTNDGNLHNSDGGLVEGRLLPRVDFFIPMPGDEDKVYCFCDNKYEVVSLSANRVVEFCDDLGLGKDSYLAVHHANCSDIWLIFFSKTKIIRYLLTTHGLMEAYSTDVDPLDYDCLYTQTPWQVALSNDCNYYCATFPTVRCRDLLYGSFDRATGEFKRLSKKTFDEGLEVYNACIAPDNSRIYCFIFDWKRGNRYLVEVSLKDNILGDYEVIKEYDKQPNNSTILFFYGLDGNIYTSFLMNRFLGQIRIVDGSTLYTEALRVLSSKYFLPTYTNVASWYMQDPCSLPYDPCTRRYDVSFENSFVCGGEPLRLVLPKGIPCSFSYSINDEKQPLVDNVVSGYYQFPYKPGRYMINWISLDGCLIDSIPNLNARTGKKLSAPVIRTN